MRSTFRSVLVALMAVFAFGALASASASAALPEFGLGTKYPVAFTGTGGVVQLDETDRAGYTCTSSSITGEIVGPKELAKIVIKVRANSPSCLAFCKQTGEVWETKELKGRIGYLAKTGKNVGLLLEPTTEPVALCTHNQHPGIKVEGSLIGEFGPVNVTTKEPTLNFRQSDGTQAWRHFEGEELTHNLLVTPDGTSEMGLEAKMTLTTARAIEIWG